MKTIRISKIDWENYQTFMRGRYDKSNLITIDQDYMGGVIHIEPDYQKRALNLCITKGKRRFYKTIDIEFDIEWFQEETGGFLNGKVEWKSRKIWRDAETLQKTYAMAKDILDGLAALESEPDPRITIFTPKQL